MKHFKKKENRNTISSSKNFSKKSYWQVWTIICVGIMLSIGLFLGTSFWENEEIQMDLKQMAEQRGAAIEREIKTKN